MAEVHDIKSLVNTLEGIGKGKIYVRKKSLNDFLSNLFFLQLMIVSFVNIRRTNVRKSIACVCKVERCIDGKC